MFVLHIRVIMTLLFTSSKCDSQNFISLLSFETATVNIIIIYIITIITVNI